MINSDRSSQFWPQCLHHLPICHKTIKGASDPISEFNVKIEGKTDLLYWVTKHVEGEAVDYMDCKVKVNERPCLESRHVSSVCLFCNDANANGIQTVVNCQEASHGLTAHIHFCVLSLTILQPLYITWGCIWDKGDYVFIRNYKDI